MALARVQELDELADALTPVHVSLIVVPFLDGLSGALQTADVDARRRPRIVVQELSQVVQFVTKVMG